VSKRLLWDVLRRERQRRTLLLTTHSMAEAEALSSRIAIMGKGMCVHIYIYAHTTRVEESRHIYGMSHVTYRAHDALRG